VPTTSPSFSGYFLHNQYEWNQCFLDIPSCTSLDFSGGSALDGEWMHAFTGIVPTEIGLLTALTFFSVAENHLTGVIPSEVGLLPSLRVLNLGENDLTGPVPSEVGLLGNLQALVIECNDLSGALPSTLANLGQVRVRCEHFTKKLYRSHPQQRL
jgi:hypothetical protein